MIGCNVPDERSLQPITQIYITCTLQCFGSFSFFGLCWLQSPQRFQMAGSQHPRSLIGDWLRHSCSSESSIGELQIPKTTCFYNHLLPSCFLPKCDSEFKPSDSSIYNSIRGNLPANTASTKHLANWTFAFRDRFSLKSTTVHQTARAKTSHHVR